MSGSLTSRWRRHLSAGDGVEVRSIDEILLTLDDKGALEGLPFMPEMLEYYGKRFEVWRRAHKTCDESHGGSIRRLRNTVHLKDVRCDGAAHGGCDASCLLFWKEQWLKRVDISTQPVSANTGLSGMASSCTIGTLVEATRRVTEGHCGELFSCQATAVSAFSSPLPWWNVGQYIRDILSGNVKIRDFIAGMFIGAINLFQCFRSGSDFGSLRGIETTTPQSNLNISPGDLVQVKSKVEISQTLNQRGKNRGLSFRPEMLPHCGGEYRVVRQVKKIIRPGTGEMISLRGDCFILDGVVCTGKMRRFCPRSVYNYWRESWLTKVPEQNPIGVEAEKPAAAPTDHMPFPATSPQSSPVLLLESKASTQGPD